MGWAGKIRQRELCSTFVLFPVGIHAVSFFFFFLFFFSFFFLSLCFGRSVNYNRDIEAFPVLRELIKRIALPDSHMHQYKSPTDMVCFCDVFCSTATIVLVNYFSPFFFCLFFFLSVLPSSSQGINHAAEGIVDDSVCCQAACAEIASRIGRYKSEIGPDCEAVKTCEQLLAECQQWKGETAS